MKCDFDAGFAEMNRYLFGSRPMGELRHEGAEIYLDPLAMLRRRPVEYPASFVRRLSSF